MLESRGEAFWLLPVGPMPPVLDEYIEFLLLPGT